MRKWCVIAYDVRDERRLRQVARLLSGYGERIQYSVFRSRLNPVELERLLWELGRVQAPEDSLLVLPLCPQCAAAVRGRAHPQPWKAPPGYRIL